MTGPIKHNIYDRIHKKIFFDRIHKTQYLRQDPLNTIFTTGPIKHNIYDRIHKTQHLRQDP